MDKLPIIMIMGVVISLVVIGLQQTLTGKVIAVNDSPADFKVFTKAVCAETPDKKICEDKIFYSCDGLEKILESDIAICKNRTIHVGKVNLGSLEILKE